MSARIKLVNASERAILYPETFHVPSLAELETLQPGDYVKIILELEGGRAERVWVQLVEVQGLEKTQLYNKLSGVLESVPLQDELPKRGATIEMRYVNVADIEKIK